MKENCPECPDGVMEPQSEENDGRRYVWNACDVCGYSSGVAHEMTPDEELQFHMWDVAMDVVPSMN